MELDELSSLPKPGLITFDFGDTIVTSQPSYLERIAMGLTRLGFARSIEEVRKAYFLADLFTAERLIIEMPFSPEKFRETFSSRFFKEMGQLDELPELGPKLAKWLVEFRPRRVMVPGAAELLERLQEAGYPLAIISNNDGNTHKKCEDVGIAQHFRFILDSTIEGCMKPDSRFFMKAVNRAGVGPGQILHVGDLWGCDVMGARAAGIPALWLGNDVVNPEPLAGTGRIRHLLELLDMIEL